MNTATHAKTVVTADDGASEVGSDEWNAQHYTTIADNGSYVTSDHMSLTTRVLMAGTGRLTVREPLTYFKGAYGMGPVEIRDDNYVLQYKRASLSGSTRVIAGGNAELFVFDLAPVGRLVLAGRGG